MGAPASSRLKRPESNKQAERMAQGDDGTSEKGWYSRGYLPHFDGAGIVQTNPVKAGLVSAPREWRWNSARYRGAE
ncbi:hypothetical protein FHP25_28870 [Vineibacter terrae]|uniref:Uncharacterized protein n=1 Tax=Vineibacter terrae TaxID=2586908 RepID=A0A5C8PEY0_9HYPH|nr:hypothetical protein [Vineibacter terrae]TXL71706.1 hypothetical protein FHP25_28870 [Vineibacter terrae]